MGTIAMMGELSGSKHCNYTHTVWGQAEETSVQFPHKGECASPLRHRAVLQLHAF